MQKNNVMNVDDNNFINMLDNFKEKYSIQNNVKIISFFDDFQWYNFILQ